MKRKLTFLFLLAAFLLLNGLSLQAQVRAEVTDVLDRELTGISGTTYTSWEDKTSNSDAVYAGQSAGGNESIQLRSNNSNSGIITTASGGTVSLIMVTWNENTADGRTLNIYGSHTAYTSPTELYEPDAQGTLLGSIVKGTDTELSISDTYEFIGLRSAAGAMYIQEIDIVWTTSGSTQPTVAAPTFTPASGTYYEAQTVTISCATEDATIYYTTDGSDPTEASLEFSAPLTISETITVKAIAMKEGYNNSNIASATYTIAEAPSPISIAEARALADDEFALVQGVVTFIDAKNVYIQDETAAIDLYLNANAPSDLALGDLVQAYGKKTIYKGLVELSNIDVNDAQQFSVISTGNELPLAMKTIAEILAGSDAEGSLQATRVKVESATIGAIDTNSNTPLTQDEATINIYKVPALTDIAEGDVVDVVGIIGYFNAPQLRVAMASDVVYVETPVITEPQLTVSVSELNGFDYIFGEGPSEIQYFELNGENLTHDITVSPSENFEVSLPGDSFQPENPALISIPESGIISGFQILVRLKAGLEVGSYNEQIAVTCEDVETLYVNVTGTVTEEGPTPPPTPTGDYVRIGDLSQLVAGSQVVFAARFDENATDYYAMSNSSSGKPTGVLFTSTTNEGSEILPASIVDEESSYYWTVDITANGYTFTNAAGELIGYSSSTNFSTGGDNTEWVITLDVAGDEAMVPNHTGFVVNNVNNTARAFALNSNHNFGPYSFSTNSNSSNYNFYLDLFVKAEGDITPTVATPTFTPAAGTYYEAQTVTISCVTEDATIYYTTDGSEPTENGLEYSAPLTISETITVKAIAMKEGYNNSNIASATYTIAEAPSPISIAEARALADDEFALVQGVVTFIDAKNVYIQDETAAIDLYLNANAPSDLALGDLVQAYGKKTIYKGLVELSNIDVNDAQQFSVISTGNELPLAMKTIAEILAGSDAEGSLQATRVKVESATIGAIDTNSNTPLTQDEATINIYKVPALTDIAEGDVVDVVGIIGYFNAPQLRVAMASDVVYVETPVITEPQLTVSVSELNGFDYIFGEGPSEIQYFELNGENLTHDITVSPSENFEVSLPGDSFQPENPALISIPESGIISGFQILVRLKAGLEVGSYNEQIAVTCEDVETLYVNVTGTVTEEGPTPPPTPTGDYVRIGDLSQLVAGSQVVFAARFDENATDYYAMSNSSSGKPTGVLFTSTTNEGSEILPASIVDEESSYYWTVDITANGYTFTNAAGELIGYSSSTNFSTGGDNTEWVITLDVAGDEAMVPNHTGFVVNNVNNTARAFALNSNHNFGPYSFSTNSNSSNYNFYLDLFVKAEGDITPTVATPTFTPAAGTYFEIQEVTINCTTDGATIYYSTDSENGPWTLYEAPIVVDESMTLWAYAEKEDFNSSNIAMATYTIQLGVVTIFSQNWEGEMNGWTFVDVEGETSWSVATYSGNKYAYANGYNHGANEDWCISPAFNLNALGNPILTFRTAKNYTGNDLEVFFSNDYDGENPTLATWTALACNLSAGSFSWTESGGIDLSAFSGTNCYIGFKYTSTEETAAAWEVDDIMLVGQTSEPVVTITPLVLNGFTYIEGNGPSNEQSFTVSGFNLSGNITINEASNYEISFVSGDDFNAQNSITLMPVGGNVEETSVFVRLKAGLEVGEYNDDDITITCADVDDIDVSCNGSVTEQPVPSGDYVRISDVGTLVAGNQVILAARYNETTNAYLAIANTLTSGKLNTTEFTSQMDGANEILPAEIMADEDGYYWTVDVTAEGYTFTNANGDVIGYGNSGTNFVMNSEKTVWTINTGNSDPASLVPDINGFTITNATTTGRGMALRITDANSIVGAYATSNMANGEYNFFLDIFMQGEGGTPTVAAPTFNPAEGTYYEPQEVTISCTTEGATIWYNFISENGPWTPYTESITVEEFASIWAYASKEGYNDSPVVNSTYIIQDDLTIIFNQDWEEDWNGWTQVSVEGETAEWTINEHSGNHYAYINAYQQGVNEDWLISPAFDLDNNSDVVLTFRTARNYNGPDIVVYFSNDYDGTDPTTATWQEIECELSTGSWNWVESGEISLDAFNGTNCYIAYKYTSTESEAAGWEVDDIMLVSGGGSTNPTITATPNIINDLSYTVNQGPSTSQSYTLVAANLEGEGDIIVIASEYFEISLDDESFGEELSIPFADGIITDQPVTVYVRLAVGLEIGTYEGAITHEGGNASSIVNIAGTVHSENEPMIGAEFMPLYIQGNNSSNNNRVPVATQVTLFNLAPNTTYRYTNQFVDANDGPETAGAGNVIYAHPEGFYRSTSPSLANEGGYGEFTTNENGEGFAWFINEPTANARFTPGNQVYLRIRINDGQDGTTVANTFTTEEYATVLNFGNEYDEYNGSAFYAKSNEAPMSFAMMFATNSDQRPIYSTPIETTGVDYGSINQYADFYKELVSGNDGWFGGILPNDNEIGVNSIWIYDITGQFIHLHDTQDGQWAPEANTVNPNSGLDDPIFIDLTDDGVDDNIKANVIVWSADHEFVVENSDNAHYNMTVYNILGQPIMQKQINAGSTQRISHNLSKGLYIISLQNNQNMVSYKVIVR